MSNSISTRSSSSPTSALDDRYERTGSHRSEEGGRRFAPFAPLDNRRIHLGFELTGDGPACLRKRPAGGIANDEEVDVLRRRPRSSEIALRPRAEDKGGVDSLDVREPVLEQGNSSKRFSQQRLKLRVERRLLVCADHTSGADALARQEPRLLEPLGLSLDCRRIEREQASELAERGLFVVQEESSEQSSLTSRSEEWQERWRACAYNAAYCA